jgi:cytochrome oxidase assembly protein ShyY1
VQETIMWLTKKWWFLIVVVPIIGLCVKAGFWQLDRADEKEDLMQDLMVNETFLSSSAQILAAENQRGTYRVRLPVVRDVREPLVFLDNRIQERVVGYEVFTRVSSIDGAIRLLVNLGWVPGSRLRSELPEVRVPENFVLKGALVPVTESYLMTGSQSESIGVHQRVQSLTDLLSKDTIAGMVLADGLLLRNAVGPMPRLGPEIHYGYAVQWFLLAIVLIGMAGYTLKQGLARG